MSSSPIFGSRSPFAGFSSRNILMVLFIAAIFLFVLGGRISAQGTAPPPLKILLKGEKDQLDGEKDVKKRTELALDLMEIHLKKAEALDAQNSFQEMYAELGRFSALMDYTLKFLNRNGNGSRKALNNFKRFEIGIRTFPPRLEVIRRNLPTRYELYVRNLIRGIRDTRSKAVEAFFDDGVVPDNDN